MAKKAKKPRAAKPKKEKSGAAAATEVALGAVVQEAAAQATDPALAAELLRAFDGWMAIREFAQKETKRTKETVEARLQSFKEAMEVGHSNQSEQLTKLTVCEMRWQEFEESRAERKDILGVVKDQTKLSLQKIKDLRAEIADRQLDMFKQSSSTIDNPPVPEDDEPEGDHDYASEALASAHEGEEAADEEQ